MLTGKSDIGLDRAQNNPEGCAKLGSDASFGESDHEHVRSGFLSNCWYVRNGILGTKIL
jgi:hypothetical protein